MDRQLIEGTLQKFKLSKSLQKSCLYSYATALNVNCFYKWIIGNENQEVAGRSSPREYKIIPVV